MGKIMKVFTLLAIIIASLGLFGLAAFIAERRTKEIIDNPKELEKVTERIENTIKFVEYCENYKRE